MIKRTKQFAVDCGHMILSLPTNVVNHAYSAQLIRSSSSVGANYRATRRAKSNADFINKFKIVEEEIDESLFFLKLMLNSIEVRERNIKNNRCFIKNFVHRTSHIVHRTY